MITAPVVPVNASSFVFGSFGGSDHATPTMTGMTKRLRMSFVKVDPNDAAHNASTAFQWFPKRLHWHQFR